MVALNIYCKYVDLREEPYRGDSHHYGGSVQYRGSGQVSSPVSDLLLHRAQVEEMEGIPAEEQVLIFGVHSLDDEKTLEEFGVEEGKSCGPARSCSPISRIQLLTVLRVNDQHRHETGRWQKEEKEEEELP